MHPVLYSAVGLPHHRNKYEISNIVRSKLSSREDLFVIFQYVLTRLIEMCRLVQ